MHATFLDRILLLEFQCHHSNVNNLLERQRQQEKPTREPGDVGEKENRLGVKLSHGRTKIDVDIYDRLD